MLNNFTIDITETLSKFSDYFEHSERMILSAKFGDGKSYLLNRFIDKDDKKNPKYYFVVLHPVNYVVEENRDIFEYIKRDILFQMLQDDKVFNFDDNLEIWDKAIKENVSWGDVYDFLMELQPLSSVKSIGKLLKIGADKYLKIRKYYNDIQNKPYTYINSFALRRGSLAECDGFTQIIQQAIKLIGEQYKQKTVLIIEDMDRLDPGHLFRILNVLGVQIDNPYFENDQPLEKERNPNKFGFNKIVLVMDYDTSEHIFHHFYGNDADYEGYMQKFIDVNPFCFSLRSEAQRMLREKIKEICFLDDNFFPMSLMNCTKNGVAPTISSYIEKLSVRKCKQIITEGILHFEYDKDKQKSTEQESYGYIDTPLKMKHIHEIWRDKKYDVLSCIDFA